MGSNLLLLLMDFQPNQPWTLLKFEFDELIIILVGLTNLP
jgi:hypothetical protein